MYGRNMHDLRIMSVRLSSVQTDTVNMMKVSMVPKLEALRCLRHPLISDPRGSDALQEQDRQSSQHDCIPFFG